MANHQHFEYKIIRPLIIFNFGGACVICNKVCKSNHVHHIDNNSSNNDAFNFVVLCGHHHRLVHRCKFAVKPLLSSSQREFLQSLNDFLNIYKP